MATGAAVVAGVGTTISLIASENARQSEEDAMKAQAKLKKAQAQELLERFEINAESLKRLGQETASAQTASFAKGGVDVGSGSSLLMMEDTFSKIQRQISLDKREADFKANQLIRGADIEMSLAGDISKAKKIENYGLFFTSAAKTGLSAYGAK